MIAILLFVEVVVIGSADWGLAEDRKLCKHDSCVVSFNIHNSPVGLDAIVPHLIGEEVETQIGVVLSQLVSSHSLPRQRDWTPVFSTSLASASAPSRNFSQPGGLSPLELERLLVDGRGSVESRKCQKAANKPTNQDSLDMGVCDQRPLT